MIHQIGSKSRYVVESTVEHLLRYLIYGSKAGTRSWTRLDREWHKGLIVTVSSLLSPTLILTQKSLCEQPLRSFAQACRPGSSVVNVPRCTFPHANWRLRRISPDIAEERLDRLHISDKWTGYSAKRRASVSSSALCTIA